jgi:hypothetical protein
MADFNASTDKAALILEAIAHAASAADQDCGDVQKSSNWLILIEAAASHAHYLITGTNLELNADPALEVSHG